MKSKVIVPRKSEKPESISLNNAKTRDFERYSGEVNEWDAEELKVMMQFGIIKS